MENKYKLLMSVLLMSFLMVGSVSAMTVEVTYVGLNPQSEIQYEQCVCSDETGWISYSIPVGSECICTYPILQTVPESELPIIEPTPSVEFIPADPDEEPLIVEPTFDVIGPTPVDLYVGDIAEDIIEPTLSIESATSGKGEQTFELGYDCYHKPGYWSSCKQVEHKVSWFIKKDFHQFFGCGPDEADYLTYTLFPDETDNCRFIGWIRFPKA